MVAEDALRNSLEHAAIVNAEMRVVVHRMGVKPQVERIGFEKVMVDQRNEGIQHTGNGENRCQNDSVSIVLPDAVHFVIFGRQNYKKRRIFACISEVFPIFANVKP